MKKNLSLLPAYLKLRVKGLVVFAVFSAVFLTVFFLSGYELDPIMYAVILCAFFSAIFIIVDFYFFGKKHKKLSELENEITLSLDNLPTAENLVEADYQRLLSVLNDNKIELLSKSDAREKNISDYHTLWAHQIKTPISAMRLLLQQSESEDAKELEGELFKIEEYVEMLLSYLRLDGENDLLIKKYELCEIVRRSVRKYAKQFIRRKISLRLEDFEYYAVTDEKWLGFVIEQLLSNSLKYTQKGEIHIYFANETLFIEDTGIGIAAEDLPRICERGFTGYNGRTDKKSTGIGLYLCKRTLDMLGHTITFSSSVGVGTRAMVCFKSVEQACE